MNSPEHKFQPDEASAADSGSSGCLPGSKESSQPDSTSEQFSSEIGPDMLPSPGNIQPPGGDDREVGPLSLDVSGEEREDQANPQNRGEWLEPIESKDDDPGLPGWKTLGRGDFYWKRDLSENGQKLYRVILLEMGDTDLLPEFATIYSFELQEALDELRQHGVIDERDPKCIHLL